VLVRALVQDEPAQGQAASAVLTLAEWVTIPLPVFCELVWVLRRVYGFTAADCSRAIEALISNRSGRQTALPLLQACNSWPQEAILPMA
jgi:predicted nucleic-acid-binding protein